MISHDDLLQLIAKFSDMNGEAIVLFKRERLLRLLRTVELQANSKAAGYRTQAVGRAVIDLMIANGTMSARRIKLELSVPATRAQIYNAIGHLVRAGRVERIGSGYYRWLT